MLLFVPQRRQALNVGNYRYLSVINDKINIFLKKFRNLFAYIKMKL